MRRPTKISKKGNLPGIDSLYYSCYNDTLLASTADQASPLLIGLTACPPGEQHEVNLLLYCIQYTVLYCTVHLALLPYYTVYCTVLYCTVLYT